MKTAMENLNQKQTPPLRNNSPEIKVQTTHREIDLPNEKNVGHLIGHIVYIALYTLLIVFSILFYNSANLLALIYVGWITLVFGIIILLSSSQSRKKSRVTENEVSKEIFVESGLYVFVRHPEFLGHILIIFSLILIAPHLINLVIGAILTLLLCLAMIEEEKRNIRKFGNAYRDYIQRVPRINLLAGMVRRMCNKKSIKGIKNNNKIKK